MKTENIILFLKSVGVVLEIARKKKLSTETHAVRYPVYSVKSLSRDSET